MSTATILTLTACIAVVLNGTTRAADLLVPGEFPTIQAAVNAALDGDVVIVDPGTYVETVNTLGKAITIRSTDPASPGIVASTILDAGGEGTALRIIFGERLDTVIDGLTITGGDGDLGGGLEVSLSDPIIRRCVITENAASDGGGAYLYVSSGLFDRCVFQANTADEGGAVYMYATSGLRFDNCVFQSNHAANRGGALRSDFADVRLLNSIVTDNEAISTGGAYYGSHSQLRLNSTLVASNTSDLGGAFRLSDDGLIARNSTIVGNVATSGTGGLALGIFTQPLFYNSIVRDNGPNPVVGVNPYVEFSNFEGGAPGPGNIDADPMFVDPGGGDYRLQPGSPSEGAGSNGWVASFDLRDLDGAVRIQDGIVDQGAYEVAGTVDTPSPAPGKLAVTTKDDGALAYGVAQPLWLFDVATGTWSKLVRDLPAFAFTADDASTCFWVHAGDTGYLGRVPYGTLELEEIGVAKDENGNSLSISGMAVRDGSLYAATAFAGGGLYVGNPETARFTRLTTFPAAYDVWDLHYDAVTDRMLLLSSAGWLPSDELGIVEIDLQTFSLTTVQQWFNENPGGEAPALQGLAVGDGMNFIFRPLYNDLEAYDAETQLQIGAFQVPEGNSWVLGGLTWVEGLGGGTGGLIGDANGDCEVNVEDLMILLANWGQVNAVWSDGDFDGDADVDIADLLLLLSHFNNTCGG
jgi:hypothetical protein